MRKASRLSDASLFSALTRLLLLAVLILLFLEMVGASVGFSSSLGQPVPQAFAGIPTQLEAITSLAVSKLPYLSFAMLVGALLVGVLGRFLTNSKENMAEPPLPYASKNPRDYLILIIAVSIAALLVWLPRALQGAPIGSDTLYYMSVVDTMKTEGPMWAITYTDKPFLYLMLFGLERLSGLSTLDYFRVLPVALAISTTASVWFFVSTFYKAAAGYASLLTAASTSLMRTSIDLYASFFAIILLFLILGIYFRNREKNSLGPRIALQIILIVILMSYWFVWIFLLAMLGLSEILSSQDRLRQNRRLFQIFLPSIAVMGLFVAVALANPPPVFWGLGSSFNVYLGRAVTPVGVVSFGGSVFDLSNLNLFVQDNLILPFLASLGVILLGPRSFHGRTIYIWTSTMLAFSLISSTGTHAALLVPLPALAGMGLRKLVESL